MKTKLLIALLLACSQLFGQALYDLRWSSEGIDYAGFMIYFNEDDIYMRVGYSYDGGYNLVHSEYHYDQTQRQDGFVVFEGLETGYVYYQTDTLYNPFHIFWAMDDNNQWTGPYAIDDYHLQNDNFDEIAEVKLTEVKPTNLTAEYLQWFYTQDDEDYYTLLEAAKPQTIQQPASNPGTSVPTLHYIMIANTLIPDIGTSTSADIHNTSSEFEGIASVLQMKFDKILITDKNFSKDQVISTLQNFQPGPNDVVIVIYSGHGFRYSDQTEPFPELDFRYSDYQEFSPQNCMNLVEINQIIQQKGARLNLIIGDCCNADIGVTKKLGTTFLAARSTVNASLPKLAKLFLESSGNIIAAGSSKGEYSYCNVTGGFFTNNLIASLREEVSVFREEDEPKWDDILSKAKESTLKMSKMGCQECIEQNPIFKKVNLRN